MTSKRKSNMRFIAVTLIPTIALSILSPIYLYSDGVDVRTGVDEQVPKAQAYRTVTHLHTSFSHDARFWSEPNLQLNNLQDQGYQVVLVSEHDYNDMLPTQTDFFIPPFKNGGFEIGKPYPNQWTQISLPRESAEYLNATDSSLSLEGQDSFHLRLTGNKDNFDLLSWAYSEIGELVNNRPVAYNLWLTFSLYFHDLPDPSNSTVYVCSIFGRRDDPSFPQISNRLCFYISPNSWEDRKLIDLTNSTGQVSIRLDPPPRENWQTYRLNLTQYALQLFDGLENIPTKYIFLRQVTVNLASKSGVPVDVYADDFQVFSSWTRAEMYDWWRNDIESYSDDNFLVIAGLETTRGPHIGAYDLEAWHDFSTYDKVEDKVKNIQRAGAISSLNHPRAFNFTAVEEGGGWGAELLEIYNTVMDRYPSSQVLKAWDQFLSQGSVIFGVAGFDSHGLKGTLGKLNPTVVSNPTYENLIIARSLNKDEILHSLREGQVYVVRSDHPLRMSLSPGLDVLQQVGGIVYTSSDTGAIMNVYLKGVPPNSELFVIQNGTRTMKVDVKEDPFHKEIHLPLTGEGSYIRMEVQYQGDRVAFSNPLTFRKANLPLDVWLALDPVLSSSKISSVQADGGKIEVQLESSKPSSAVLRIHSPLPPIGLKIDGNDYTKYEVTTIQDLVQTTHGWNYQSRNQILTLKLTNEGPSTITIEFSEQLSKNHKPTSLPLFEIIAISAGSGVILMLVLNFRYKFLRRKPGENRS